MAAPEYRFRRLVAASLFVALALCPLALSQSSEVEKAFHQGTEALRSGQLDEASADFSRVIALSPAFAEAYFNLGLARDNQNSRRRRVPDGFSE
ncbi:MAG: tetratricopeptide repeat protein [Terriglobales bacterium]|jgi:Flp pilus assembly protein TadD